jgi:hypothetical protein
MVLLADEFKRRIGRELEFVSLRGGRRAGEPMHAGVPMNHAVKKISFPASQL